MTDTGYTYKSNQIFAPLPSCALDIAYFKKLYEILNKITQEAAEIEISKLKKNPGQSDDDFNKLKDYAKSLYNLSIQIFGRKGEYIFSDSPSIFDEVRLPDHITKIIFDNSLKFNFSLKKDPLNKIRVEFDFQKAKVFDFVTSPSEATPNTSTIYVLGENETWVSGAYKNVIQSLQERANKRNWLHKTNIYDLFLWFIVMPLGFFSIYKIDRAFSLRTSGISSIFVAALYLYFFIIVLNLFRMAFNYARWVFPKMEVITALRKGAIVHRIILGMIFFAIFTSFIYDLLKLIFKF